MAPRNRITEAEQETLDIIAETQAHLAGIEAERNRLLGVGHMAPAIERSRQIVCLRETLDWLAEILADQRDDRESALRHRLKRRQQENP
jgi:hypothetical protein